MPKTTFGSGTIVTPEFLNSLQAIIFDDQDLDGHYARLGDDALSNAATAIKARLAAIANEFLVTAGTGLYVEVQGGRARTSSTVVEVGAGSLLCTDNATNYISVTHNGTLAASTIAPTSGALLATVLTSGGAIAQITDKRARWYLPTADAGGYLVLGDLGAVSDRETLIWDDASSEWVPGPNLPEPTVGGAGKVLKINANGDGYDLAIVPGVGASGYAVSEKIKVVPGFMRTVSLGQVVAEQTVTVPDNETSDGALIPVLSAAALYAEAFEGKTYTVSASSVYGTPNPLVDSLWSPWRAFNGVLVNEDGGASNWASGTLPAWIKIQISGGVTAGSYGIQPNGFDYQPTDWTLEGSNDNSAWTVLSTVVDEQPFADGQLRTYPIASPASYTYYRLNVTQAFGYRGSSLVLIPVLQLYGTASSGGTVTVEPVYVPESERSIYTSRMFGLSLGRTGFVWAVLGLDDGADAIAQIQTSTRSITSRLAIPSDFNVWAIAYDQVSSDNRFRYSSIQSEGTGEIAYASPLDKVFIASAGRLLSWDLGLSTSVVIDLGLEIIESVLYANSLIYCTRGTASEPGMVSVINPSSNVITENIEVGISPRQVAYADGQSTLYVANSGSNTVTVIDAIGNSILTAINVGVQPYGVAVDPGIDRAIVSNSGGGNVTMINTVTNTASGSVSLGVGSNPRGIAIDTTNHRAFVTCKGYHQVAVIDLQTSSLLARVPVDPEPVKAVYVADRGEIYVSSENGTITIIATN